MDFGPLGNQEDELDDMDLTAHLEQAMHSYKPGRDSNDGTQSFYLGDLGGASQYQQPPYAGGAPDHQPSQHLDGEGPQGVHPQDQQPQQQQQQQQQQQLQQPPDFTYNQLVLPPSYEESVMYEPAPVHHEHQQQQQQQQLPGTNLATPPPYHLPQPNYTAAAATIPTAVPTQQPSPSDALLPPPSMATFLSHCAHVHAPLVISVSEPVKREQAGMFGFKGGYVSYLVTTRALADTPGFTSGSQSAVRRRFNDFVALASALKVRLRGYFLPPRPHKSAVEGQLMADSFIEERRSGLERYLQRLAMHEAAVKSEEFQLFLKAEGDLEANPAWTALRPIPSAGIVDGTAKLSKQLLGWERSVIDPVQATQPTKRSSDILRAMREASQAMHQQQAGVGGLPEGEAELRRAREKLEVSRDALMHASRAAEKLVQRMDRCGAVYGDLGLALFKMSKAEEVEGLHLAHFTGTVKQSHTLSKGCRQAGTSSVRVSRIVHKAVSKAACELGVLHEQLANMPPAIKGLTTREEQLLTATTLQADMDSRNNSIREIEASNAKVLGGAVDQKQARRLEELRNDVSKLEYSLAAASAEYERIAAVNQQELVRLQAEQKEDMLRMAHAFTTTQVMRAERDAEVWLSLAGELGATPEALGSIRETILASHALQQPQQS